jgi:hypothetical protein
MKIFIDSEFVDDGKTIDLISIGLVAEDGRELYLQSCEFDPEKASPWVQENVFTTLLVCPHLSGNVRGLYAHAQGQCTFETPCEGITGLSGLTLPGAYLIGAYADCPWRTREQIKRDEENQRLGQIEEWCKASPLLWDIVARIGWEINEG